MEKRQWRSWEDFRNEMLRLGIDEAGRRVRNGSAADRIVREAEAFYPTLTARLRECLASPLHSSKNEDFAFFRMVLCHSAAIPTE